MKMLKPHRLLIASRHADEYHQIFLRAGLDVSMTVWDPQDVMTRSSQGKILPHDMFFGEPSLLRPMLPLLPKLLWAQVTWAGIELLLDPDLPRHYILTNARGVFGALMAEYVFSYLLAHERRILSRWQAQQANRWDATPPGSLRGKTLGLLGVGSIGATVASIAHQFGMRVHGYTRQSETCRDVDIYFHPPERLDFASGVNYLVALLPNTPHTHHLVDAELISVLSCDAVLINAGRGSTVDEYALSTALQAGKLALAVLDVFQHEPLPLGHPFWSTPNILITSHTAALNYPPDLAAIFIDNYRRFISGEPLLYKVDFSLGY